MKESELLYFYPYYIDRKYNFRGIMSDGRILEKYEPKYERILEDGNIISKIKDYQKNIKIITKNKYIRENFRSWVSWYKGGRNIFSFSKELLQLLEKTDVNDITYQSFHLPFDNFYISLRPLEIPVSKDSNKIVEGVYVSIDRLAMKKSDPEDNTSDFLFAISFDFVGDFEEFKMKYHDKIWDSAGDGIGGVNFWQYAFYFIENDNEKILTIEDAIKDVKEIFKFSYFPENKDELINIHLDAYNYQLDFIEKTCRVLVNCLLYLSLPRESLDINKNYPSDLPYNFNKKLSFAKSDNTKKKIENKISNYGYSKINFVGNSFKNLKNQNKITNGELPTHWRRGHWRNQLYGENHKVSKLIWIKPTIVNKHKGDATKGHIYTTE